MVGAVVRQSRVVVIPQPGVSPLDDQLIVTIQEMNVAPPFSVKPLTLRTHPFTVHTICKMHGKAERGGIQTPLSLFVPAVIRDKSVSCFEDSQHCRLSPLPSVFSLLYKSRSVIKGPRTAENDPRDPK